MLAERCLNARTAGHGSASVLRVAKWSRAEECGKAGRDVDGSSQRRKQGGLVFAITAALKKDSRAFCSLQEALSEREVVW